MFDVWNTRDFDALDAVIAVDAVDHDPQNPYAAERGPEPQKRLIRMYLAAFPDCAMRVDAQIAEADAVVTRWTATGTNDGDFMGMPATGKSVTTQGISISHFQGGKVVESWNCWDTLGLLQQLGVFPATT
ncbi:ester cyclase [Nocardia seriolae]|uniref:ester cyclase n=1 Tax=Nocardia seriolae TaxID=37332 RepID=UPI00051A3DED|nr:ester cyclase [Nocardia seriolae]MTJ62116.1 ester cyclase [Nocardia seriolae]MTJ72311.1 ester cyclase [Nocardia seriolae]MTJ87030.1 ester cyclase [Nocardia seriolae]MTK31026.1 ester cyclase [Nocardia seriolae]MTK40067.1 ester cyclase [Nocardia seriolae]